MPDLLSHFVYFYIDVLNGKSQGGDDLSSSSCQDSSFSSTSADPARLTPDPCATACTFRVFVKDHREKKNRIGESCFLKREIILSYFC